MGSCIETICRSSVQDAFCQHRKDAETAAWRRCRAVADARQVSREQAKAWKKQVLTQRRERDESRRKAAELEQQTREEQLNADAQRVGKRNVLFGDLVSKVHKRRDVRKEEGASEPSSPRVKPRSDPNRRIAELRRRHAAEEKLQKLQARHDSCAAAFKR